MENVPDEVRRRLKVVAAMRGVTMRQAVVEAVTAWCDRNSPAGPLGGQGSPNTVDVRNLGVTTPGAWAGSGYGEGER